MTAASSSAPEGVMLDVRLDLEEPQQHQQNQPPIVRVKEGSEVLRSFYDSVEEREQHIFHLA